MKQDGIIKIRGSFGGLTFYRRGKEHLVKEKAIAGFDSDAIRTKVNLSRIKENNQEFALAAMQSRFIINAIEKNASYYTDGAAPYKIANRIRQATKLIPSDQVRGARSLLDIEEPALILKDFDVNNKAKFTPILGTELIVNIDKTAKKVSVIIPQIRFDLLKKAKGADSFKIHTAVVACNLKTGKSAAKVKSTDKTTITTNSFRAASQAEIAFPEAKAGDLLFVYAAVEFIQTVNGEDYRLYNKKHAPLAILDATKIE